MAAQVQTLILECSLIAEQKHEDHDTFVTSAALPTSMGARTLTDSPQPLPILRIQPYQIIIIGLDSLNYGDLSISQGTGDYSSHTIVKYGTEFY